MKRISLKLIAITTLFLGWSCDEDVINLAPIGDTEAGFFQNEEQMTAAIFGVYQKLNFFYIWNGQEYLQRVDLLPSDDITVNSGFPHEIFSNLNGNDRHTTEVYQFAYQLIARANIVLQKIEQNGDFAYDEGSDLRNIHRGEALFLRSLMYLKLWNTFGTAPLITERIQNLDQAFPPNTSGVELLDQAVIDLEEAVSLLPETWDAFNLGRANKNSARGLLVKVLVFRGHVGGNNADFTQALNIFNAITATLADNYDDNFSLFAENNVESLFEFQANRQANRTNGWVGGDNDAFAVIGELNSYYGYFTGRFSGGGNPVFTATQSLRDAYPPGDPRFSFVFRTDNNERFAKYITNDVLLPNALANPGNTMSENNTRILRYADVLLLAAEATVRSGGSLSTAIGYVNQIRTRARNSVSPAATEPADLPTPSTPAAALNLIFQERRLELAGEEGHRWHDLRRRHLAGEIDLTTIDFGSSQGDFNFQEFNLFFPLPENEVIQSPNLNQNPGY